MPRTGSIASNVGPAVSSTRRPASSFGCRPGDDGVEDLLRLQHPALAGLAARLVAAAGAEHDDAVGDEPRDVALVGRVRPHLPVHRGRDEQRAVARERQRGQQIVGVTVGDLGEKVGRRRRDDDRVGAARQVDVAHPVVRAGLPQIGEHRPAGERLQRQRRDEAAGGGRHADVHRDVRLDEEPRELGGLVRGDAAGQAEHDPRKRLGFHHPNGECGRDGAKFTLPRTRLRCHVARACAERDVATNWSRSHAHPRTPRRTNARASDCSRTAPRRCPTPSSWRCCCAPAPPGKARSRSPAR